MLLLLCGSAGGSALRYFYPHLGTQAGRVATVWYWKRDGEAFCPEVTLIISIHVSLAQASHLAIPNIP